MQPSYYWQKPLPVRLKTVSTQRLGISLIRTQNVPPSARPYTVDAATLYASTTPGLDIQVAYRIFVNDCRDETSKYMPRTPEVGCLRPIMSLIRVRGDLCRKTVQSSVGYAYERSNSDSDLLQFPSRFDDYEHCGAACLWLSTCSHRRAAIRLYMPSRPPAPPSLLPTSPLTPLTIL